MTRLMSGTVITNCEEVGTTTTETPVKEKDLNHEREAQDQHLPLCKMDVINQRDTLGQLTIGTCRLGLNR